MAAKTKLKTWRKAKIKTSWQQNRNLQPEQEKNFENKVEEGCWQEHICSLDKTYNQSQLSLPKLEIKWKQREREGKFTMETTELIRADSYSPC